MRRLRVGQIATPGAANGDMPAYDAATDRLVMGPPPASGVESVVAGPGVAVDATDPAHPVVSASATTHLVPLTTETAGVPDLVWDDDNQLVLTEGT